MNTIRDSQKRIWTVASLAAPTVHFAASIPWMEAAVVSLLAAGIAGIIKGKQGRPWMRYASAVFSAAAAGQALVSMGECWPNQSNMEWVMAILLFAAAYGASGGKQVTVQTAIVLWWLIAFLLGSVLLSAIPQIRIGNLRENAYGNQWVNDIHLLVVLLLPMVLKSESRTAPQAQWTLGGIALAVSLCCTGVLYPEQIVKAEAPFYELSRSIRVYATVERMEALAWLAMMLGTYLYLSYLMTVAYEEQQVTEKGRKIRLILSAAAALGIFAAGLQTAEILLTAELLYAISLILERKNNTEKYGNKG